MQILSTDPGQALVIFLASLAVAWIVNFLMERIIIRATRLTQTRLDDVIVQVVSFPLRGAIVAIGAQIALARSHLVPAEWELHLDRVFFVVYLFLVYALVVRLINGLSQWYGREVAHKTASRIDDQFLTLFRRIALIIVSLIVFSVWLDRFGVDISAFITTLGIGSLAIALAAQATLADMIAGFVIMVDRPFAIGDRVSILDIDTWGDVTDIGLRSTRILTRDNRMVAVPNSVIGKGLIVNYSVPDTVFRVETHVGVAYGTDVDRAREIMIAAVRAEPWVMQDRPIEALMLEFGDSGLIFRVRCWIEHYVETRRIIDKMNTALYGALKRANIVIPFPQRDLHLVSSVEPIRIGLDAPAQAS